MPDPMAFEGAPMPAAPRGRVPPHSLDAERAVLGGILLDNAALASAAEILEPDDFYGRANALLFAAMLELYRKGAPVDLITLRAWLVDRGTLQKAGGDEHIITLTETIPTVENIAHHANIVREKSLVRRLIQSCHEIAARGYGDFGEVEEFIDDAEKQIFDVTKQKSASPYEHIRDVVIRTFEQVTEAADRKEMISGLPTGFGKLDRMTAGFKAGELIIIAGRPGMGKTALAMNIATHACAARTTPVVVFNLEMAKEELAKRLLCSEARVDGGRLRTGMLSRDDWTRLTSAAGTLTNMPLFIDDTPAITVMELRGKARRLKAEHGLGMIVVDYLQLMRAGTKVESREKEVSEISRSLKALAKELSVPIVALSQLNRGVETRAGKDKRPQLADLRESGAIEQDADVILFVFREEFYNRDDPDLRGIAELIIGKQRAGPVGTVKCRFFHEYTRFENLGDDFDDGMEGGGFDPGPDDFADG
ncbi:MAG: replicative DNA helicase [Sandaracinaceae bacterium]|nr:replicative DNA helicase [Sandaracinaceae bacterium]